MPTASQQVNFTENGSQNSASITYLADGGWITVWHGPGPGDQSLDVSDGVIPFGGVFFKRYDSQGVQIAGETLVNSNINDEQSFPEVVALAVGGFAIVYFEEGATQQGDPYNIFHIFARTYDAEGQPLGEPVQVNDEGVPAGTVPLDELSLVARPDGGFEVLWGARDWEANPEIEAEATFPTTIGDYGVSVMARQKFNAIGAKVGTNTVAEESHIPHYVEVSGNTFLQYDTVYYEDIVSTFLTNGNQLIVWQGKNAQDPDFANQERIYRKIVDSDGVTVSPVQAINDDFHAARHMDVAALAGGTFAIVWQQRTEDTNYHIRLQLFDSAGEQEGPEINVRSGDEMVAGSIPKIAALSEGGWVVAWTGSDDGGVIHAQMFDSEGNEHGGLITLEVATDNFQVGEITVEALSNGEFIIGWDEGPFDLGIFGFQTEVYQQRYDADGNMLDAGEGGIGGRDITVAMDEDTSFTFDQDDFGFSSAGGGPFNTVTVETLPGDGTLFLDEVAVTAGQTIAVADVGQLRYAPKKDDFGPERFTFNVHDGIELSDTFTFTFDIADIRDFFTGTNKKNTLRGTDGMDTLDGKKGNDTLIGNKGPDIYVFKTNWDKDTIKGFDAKGGDHDILDIRGLKSVKNWKDLKKNHLEKHGKHVWIDGGKGDVIKLLKVKIGDLGADDFLI